MSAKNRIVIISQEGANSDQIKYEFNGVRKSVENCESNWAMIRVLSSHEINEVRWERRDLGGWVIESGAFDEFGNPMIPLKRDLTFNEFLRRFSRQESFLSNG